MEAKALPKKVTVTQTSPANVTIYLPSIGRIEMNSIEAEELMIALNEWNEKPDDWYSG